ncbi:hypothetical protein EVAR_48534_1 [Eumeta japonica]|uniref:Uncharacterized protein n=1 Tax=Eumeta variegata TaxID=151549 RepID=A0A4C1Y717_EUMVA|nr:hypothetical protein EVAR_48534_1 [Eumeta japonica]
MGSRGGITYAAVPRHTCAVAIMVNDINPFLRVHVMGEDGLSDAHAPKSAARASNTSSLQKRKHASCSFCLGDNGPDHRIQSRRLCNTYISDNLLRKRPYSVAARPELNVSPKLASRPDCRRRGRRGAARGEGELAESGKITFDLFRVEDFNDAVASGVRESEKSASSCKFEANERIDTERGRFCHEFKFSIFLPFRCEIKARRPPSGTRKDGHCAHRAALRSAFEAEYCVLYRSVLFPHRPGDVGASDIAPGAFCPGGTHVAAGTKGGGEQVRGAVGASGYAGPLVD